MSSLATGWAFRIRVAVLLATLAIVALYAWHDVAERRARNEFKHTLSVALVIVNDGAVDAQALDALRARVPALERRLALEFQRYRPEGPEPFGFVVFGPVPEGTPPPASAGEGFAGMVRHALELWRFTRDVDARAFVPRRGFDARLYLVARPPADARRTFVEGASEQGGRIGVALVELDPSMADFALFVAAHELLHTLGATDKYDSGGRSRIPEGLAEPTFVPRFPQRFAEVMAENRPIDATHEEPPTSLDQLRVGPLTAAEIGWQGKSP